MPGPMILVRVDGAERLDVPVRASGEATIGAIKAKVSTITGIPTKHLHIGSIIFMADADEWGDLGGDTDASDSEAPAPGASEEEAAAEPLQQVFEGIEEDPRPAGAAQEAPAPDAWDMWMHDAAAPAEEAPAPGAAEAAPAASSTAPGPHALWLVPAPAVKYQSGPTTRASAPDALAEL